MFNKILIASSLLFGSLLISPAANAVKCPTDSVRSGSDVTSLVECNLDVVDDENTLLNTVQTVITVAIGLLAVVCVGMIILGGYQYTLSSGDSARTTKASRTIMYGVIGLVIALLAYAIVNFALSSLFGANGGGSSSGGGSGGTTQSYTTD